MRFDFAFWRKWLIYINIIFVVFGILVAFANNSFIFGLWNEKTDDLFFSTIPPESVIPFRRFLLGIIGGTMAGFHLLMVFIAKYAFKKQEKWAYDSLLYGTLLWFVIDSTISTHYQAYHNVYLINIVAFIGIGIPLFTTRKYFLTK